MTDALRAELEPHARKLEKRLRKAAKGDVDGVHDSRTTIRRLREGLVVMGRTVFDPDYVAKCERELHRIEKSLGPTRDDDVFLADLDRWVTAASAERRQGLKPLKKHLERLRERDAEALREALRRKSTDRAMKRLRRLVAGKVDATKPPPKNPARAAPSLVKHFLAEETWWAYEEVLAYETRMPASLDVVHKVRSAGRSLRFALELFCDALPPGVKDVIDALKALQDRLGDLHDHAVAVERIARWRSDGEIPDTEALTAYLEHRASERDRLQGEFDAEWRAITGEAFRYTLSHLVSGEIGTERPNGAVRLTASRP